MVYCGDSCSHVMACYQPGWDKLIGVWPKFYILWTVCTDIKFMTINHFCQSIYCQFSLIFLAFGLRTILCFCLCVCYGIIKPLSPGPVNDLLSKGEFETGTRGVSDVEYMRALSVIEYMRCLTQCPPLMTQCQMKVFRRKARHFWNTNHIFR